MAKVGLKDTLTLLAKGYSKKDIDALAAVDEEQEKNPAAEENIIKVIPVETENPESSKHEKQEKTEEPDYKAMYEELLAKNKESEAKITKLQKDNIHKDSSEISYEKKKKEEESLQALVRGFM